MHLYNALVGFSHRPAWPRQSYWHTRVLSQTAEERNQPIKKIGSEAPCGDARRTAVLHEIIYTLTRALEEKEK